MITPTMDHTMSMQPASMMGPLTQQMNHLSLGTTGTVRSQIVLFTVYIAKRLLLTEFLQVIYYSWVFSASLFCSLILPWFILVLLHVQRCLALSGETYGSAIHHDSNMMYHINNILISLHHSHMYLQICF